MADTLIYVDAPQGHYSENEVVGRKYACFSCANASVVIPICYTIQPPICAIKTVLAISKSRPKGVKEPSFQVVWTAFTHRKDGLCYPQRPSLAPSKAVFGILKGRLWHPQRPSLAPLKAVFKVKDHGFCPRKGQTTCTPFPISTKTADILNMTKRNDFIRYPLQNGKHKQYIQRLKNFPNKFQRPSPVLSKTCYICTKTDHFITYTTLH